MAGVEELKWLIEYGFDLNQSDEEIASRVFASSGLDRYPDRLKDSVRKHVVGRIKRVLAGLNRKPKTPNKNSRKETDEAAATGREQTNQVHEEVSITSKKTDMQQTNYVGAFVRAQVSTTSVDTTAENSKPVGVAGSGEDSEAPESSKPVDVAGSGEEDSEAPESSKPVGVAGSGEEDNEAPESSKPVGVAGSGEEDSEAPESSKPADPAGFGKVNNAAHEGGIALTGGDLQKKADNNGVPIVNKQLSEAPGFKDLSGMDGILESLWMDVKVAINHPQALEAVGETPVKGILLHGPPGCGKTTVARALAKEANVQFMELSAPQLVGTYIGTSEERIRDVFKMAYEIAPTILFIDEIDAIASKRGSSSASSTDKRMVTQLMACMDTNCPDQYVLVIGATNRPDVIDPALRRNGRFDREILIPMPDETARGQILTKLMRNRNLDGSCHVENISRITSGFVCADLKALVQLASHIAIKRIFDNRKAELTKEGLAQGENIVWWDHNGRFLNPLSDQEAQNLRLTMSHFEEALKRIQPSTKREGFSTIPRVGWQDIGGLDSLREQFELEIVNRIKYPKVYEGLGIDMDSGILLHGPPGCGKTLIAMAVAGEAGANFIHVKGAELLHKYYGESEKSVRLLFDRARTCSPCIIFFDEVDALAAKRDKKGDDQCPARILNQLLAELDGGAQRKGVYVIGATNRLEAMDPAVLRPGRFGKHLYVPLPGPKERESILRTLCRKKALDADVDLAAIAQSKTCENLSGADLAALMHEAAMVVLKDNQPSVQSNSNENPSKIKMRHLETALTKISKNRSAADKDFREPPDTMYI